ncbi:LysM peptidoglycan-binding domain-containing protein [Schaalia vaccimaxillae]|uniref:LysM peptidoglycan-binding domain-containing protein n=1 Tax=Schaalia vaccimaxillae TaxID=183916 RepID=UPI0003B5E29A|nr:LysM peptidoglycan-binding domain-containing protein [Schaalia vaccimaxillae]
MNDAPIQLDHRGPLTELALWTIGVPAGALLCLALYTLRERANVHHPEVLITCAICAFALAALAWNLYWSTLARLSGLALIPRQIRTFMQQMVLSSGTQRARQIVLRSGAGAILGVSVAAGGLSSTAFAAPTTPEVQPQNSSSAGDDWAWGATQVAPKNVPSPQPTTPNSDLAPQSSNIVVQEGDSLWSISAQILGPDVSPEDINQYWPQLYQANLATIGDNPDLIHPGQVLVSVEEGS